MGEADGGKPSMVVAACMNMCRFTSSGGGGVDMVMMVILLLVAVLFVQRHLSLGVQAEASDSQCHLVCMA